MIPLVILALALTYPNPQLTPGVLATVPDGHGGLRPLTVTEICGKKWGLDRRFVTEKMKREIAASYGLRRSDVVARGKGPCCEYDHKLPRELGGADDVRNIGPQPWVEAHVKDVRENQLHVAVCKGTISLDAAQDEMRHWGRP